MIQENLPFTIVETETHIKNCHRFSKMLIFNNQEMLLFAEPGCSNSIAGSNSKIMAGSNKPCIYRYCLTKIVNGSPSLIDIVELPLKESTEEGDN